MIYDKIIFLLVFYFLIYLFCLMNNHCTKRPERNELEEPIISIEQV